MNGEFMSSISLLLPLSYLSGSVFGIRVRIHKETEYGSNLDPVPQHWIDFIFRYRYILRQLFWCVRTWPYLLKMRSFSGRSHQKSRLCIPQPLHEYSVPVFDIFFLFSFRIFHVSLNPLKVSLQYIIKFNIIIYYVQ